MITPRRFIHSAAALLVVLVAGCAPASEDEDGNLGQTTQAIVGGYETFTHPDVGSLQIYGVGYCTGTLIRPNIVLTAAHCLNWQDQLTPAQRGTFAITGANGAGPYVALVARFEALSHNHGELGKNDIGLAILDSAVPSGWATPYRVGATYPVINTPAAIYGYGSTTPNGVQSVGAGVKRRHDFSWWTNGEAGFNYLYDVVGPGDSGGPVMTATTGIVGVVSGNALSYPYQAYFGNVVLNFGWIGRGCKTYAGY